MTPLLDNGIHFILFLQSQGSWLVGLMKFFTFLGNEEFYLLVAPAILWCLNAVLGLRLGLFLVLSASVNDVFKLALHQPRPFWYDSRVHAYAVETTFGIPSGHSQHAAVVWGAMAAWLQRAWAWAAAIVLILLIGLSRMVLGMHFPSDVLVGWVIGALVLWALLSLEAPLLRLVRKLVPLSQILAAFVASLFLILVVEIARLSLGDWSMPVTWLQNAALALPGEPPPDPLAISGTISNAGVFFGLATGAILLSLWGGFSTAGVWWKRALRFPPGLVGVLVLYFGLGMVFPHGASFLDYTLRYLRYALVGMWISGLAPLVFIRLGLASSQPAAEIEVLAHQPGTAN